MNIVIKSMLDSLIHNSPSTIVKNHFFKILVWEFMILLNMHHVKSIKYN